MEQPERYNDKSGRACKLIQSLYGLKQEPRRKKNFYVNVSESRAQNAYFIYSLMSFFYFVNFFELKCVQEYMLHSSCLIL